MDDYQIDSQIKKEVESIRLVWLKFVDEINNGSATEIHQPVAVVAACQSMIPAYFGKWLDESYRTGSPVMIDTQQFIEFIASMVAFGQYMAKQGMKVENFTPCKCIEVDDKELKEFLSKN